MILIKPYNSSVKDLVLAQFQANIDHQKNPSCYPTVPDVVESLADFDGALYRIVQSSNSNILSVSISLSFQKEIEKYGDYMVFSSISYFFKVLVREYGSHFKRRVKSGNCVTLEFDCNHLPDDLEATAAKAALLHRNCFASVFEHFFDYQVANASSPGAKVLQGTIHFRADETMFVQAMSDRVTVIFSTQFKDPDDVVLGKVFLQGFSEVKRRYDGAPQVIYQPRDPPKELQGTDTASGENIAYITFVLSPRHVSPQFRAKTIDLIHLLRTYLHYHIKCMKANLQMRMRAKTGEFLKILNRAHPNADAVASRNYAVTESDALGIQMLRSSTSFEDLASFRTVRPI
ncbi:Actin-related protein 2/3 complex subunit 2-B [Taenia crassiceps]|uniref:Arp2/3 complex 34 kDa subunit n=1 Tax=Taenia crassiceps TaxID=6207 RepID=A0ABR4Q8B2_9CEST